MYWLITGDEVACLELPHEQLSEDYQATSCTNISSGQILNCLAGTMASNGDDTHPSLENGNSGSEGECSWHLVS